VALGRGDALLELAHLVGQGGLVADRGGHAPEQRRDLCAGLDETEDVVDEEQHVLLLFVAEVLGHGQRGQPDPQAHAGRLVHLAEHQGGLFQDAGLAHLQDEVVALAGALADAGEHAHAAVLLGDPVDHLLDDDGLADAGAAEHADLAALDVRGQQVDDLDAGLEHLRLGLELVEVGRVAVDRPAEPGLDGLDVQRLAEHVEHVAAGDRADGDADRGAAVGHRRAADHAVGRAHGDGPDRVRAHVLGDLADDGLLVPADRRGQGERVEDLRELVGCELDVDDRADDPDHAPLGSLGLLGLAGCACHQSLPVFWRASAPPTISMISCVISAWRAWFSALTRTLISSSALSVAAFMARRLAADSLAADSSSAVNTRDSM
jgi:peptide chain release factor 1